MPRNFACEPPKHPKLDFFLDLCTTCTGADMRGWSLVVCCITDLCMTRKWEPLGGDLEDRALLVCEGRGAVSGQTQPWSLRSKTKKSLLQPTDSHQSQKPSSIKNEWCCQQAQAMQAPDRLCAADCMSSHHSPALP